MHVCHILIFDISLGIYLSWTEVIQYNIELICSRMVLHIGKSSVAVQPVCDGARHCGSLSPARETVLSQTGWEDTHQ